MMTTDVIFTLCHSAVIVNWLSSVWTCLVFKDSDQRLNACNNSQWGEDITQCQRRSSLNTSASHPHISQVISLCIICASLLVSSCANLFLKLLGCLFQIPCCFFKKNAFIFFKVRCQLSHLSPKSHVSVYTLYI